MRFNPLIPELYVSDFQKSLHFYTQVLGFKAEYRREEQQFAFLSLGKCQLMIQQAEHEWCTGKLEHPYGRGINLQIHVEKAQPILTMLAKKKCPLFAKQKDSLCRKGKILLGCREFLVQDPDGYLLRFSEDIGSKSVAHKDH